MDDYPLIDHVQFNDQGLVPTIVQDAASGQVLMLAYMNEAALRHTLDTGRMTYWSRSRRQLWRKGETSGHVQHVREVRLDCDGDTLLFKVEQVGDAACHTGHRSCFYRAYDDGALVDAGELIFDPEEVYGDD